VHHHTQLFLAFCPLPFPPFSFIAIPPTPSPPFLSPLSCVFLFLFSLAPLPQVSRIAAYAYSALSQIRVDAKEELVVQFGIP
jgi:hypothetical protein